MELKYPELFKPFKVGNVTIKNRIAMSPMRLGTRYAADGNITDEIIDFYEARAKGGFGLIYTGGYAVNCGVEESYKNVDPMKNVAVFRSTIGKLADKVHAYNTKLFVGIGSGAGRAMFPHLMTPKMKGQSIAPSAIPNRWDPNVICRPLTTEECEAIVQCMIDAAVQVQGAGADGVGIGGPYGGYLTDQFMTSIFNQREDEFGYHNDCGARIVTEVIKGVRKRCGQNFAIDVRMGVKHYMKGLNSAPLPGEEFVEYGRDTEESIRIAKALEAAGADALTIGNGSYDSFYWLYPPTYMPEGLWLESAKAIKDAVGIPVICPGKINTPELANEAIKNGMIDCVALGRASLADPDWANKARAGVSADIRPCIGCHVGCIGRNFNGENVTCAVNPQAFYEKTDPVTPALLKKHVVVVGGGVGGMEAARVAALRGHHVDLYEKTESLGGLFRLASVPDFKRDDRKLLDWYARAMEQAGVHVHLNHAVSADELEELAPDEIVVATGAVAKRIPLKGIETCHSLTASEVLEGAETGNHVAIIGGGLVGCEVAVWLANQGKKVALIEALPELMSARVPTPKPNFLMMLDMLKAAKVEVYTSAAVQYIDGKHVIIKTGGEEQCVEADTVVQAVGYAANDMLYQELAGTFAVPVWNIGDSKEPANVLAAIRDGFFVGKNI